MRAGIAEVLGEEDDTWSIEFTERVVGNRSPVASPLMDMISTWISGRDPGAQAVPVVLPGFTDSRHFRVAFPECVAYGFFPQRHQTLLESAPLIHGADERIDVRDLAFAAELFRDVALRVLGVATRKGSSSECAPPDRGRVPARRRRRCTFHASRPSFAWLSSRVRDGE